jgi:DNA invertase Pin-like site-specific DNA recombinase
VRLLPRRRDEAFQAGEALAQFERRLIQERTRDGLAAALARGKKGGRKPRRAEEPRVHMTYTRYVDQRLTIAEICQTLRISQATFYCIWYASPLPS